MTPYPSQIKPDPDEKNIVPDIQSDEDISDADDIEIISSTPRSSASNEISPLWHFTLGDDRYYIIFKRVAGAKYKFNLVKNDTEIHITAEYTPTDSEIAQMSRILKLQPSFITPHFNFTTMQTVLKPPKPILNSPTVHHRSNDEFAVISYPIKKSFSVMIE
jgi:hypothetical protein